MTYYKVRAQYADRPVYRALTMTTKAYYSTFIKDELYTAKELDRLRAKGVLINLFWFDEVQIPKSRICWSFGSRFECKA